MDSPGLTQWMQPSRQTNQILVHVFFKEFPPKEAGNNISYELQGY